MKCKECQYCQYTEDYTMPFVNGQYYCIKGGKLSSVEHLHGYGHIYFKYPIIYDMDHSECFNNYSSVQFIETSFNEFGV